MKHAENSGVDDAAVVPGSGGSRAGVAGFSVVEMLLGVVVFATIAIVLGNHITTNYLATGAQRDRVFAYTKAQALLSEVHAFVDSGQVDAAIELDSLDDGVTPVPQLTIMRDANGALLPPDHPISGNIQRQTQWVWSRQITVRPFVGTDNRNVRYVSVRVYHADVNGNRTELASLSSVVNSIGSSFPTTQVFDVYLLAIENIPGWWVYMEAIVPFVESAVTDLENRNPGLELRTHWITKAAYGRNPLYRPHSNDVADSYTASEDVYYYPGRMPSGNSSTFYYVPSLIDARMDIDGEEQNAYDVDTNPYPYTLADFFNHAMRYPRAKAFHEERVAAIRERRQEILDAQIAGLTPPDEFDDMSEEPPLQILLEDMATSPDDFEHALLVNLHGELIPFPPLNNVSSPAKDPENLPYVRVVTHPEQLRAERPNPSGGEAVELRVYSYLSDPDEIGSYPNGRLDLLRPIELRIMDLDLEDAGFLASGVKLYCNDGGVPIGGFTRPYTWKPAPEVFSSGPAFYSTGEMCYGAWFVDPGNGQRKYTRILLFNSPLTCPVYTDVSGDETGLENSERARLYGLEYNPAPTQGLDFAVDLTTANNAGPKNTARWRLAIDPQVFADARFVGTNTPVTHYDPVATGDGDHMLTVQTRIYDFSPTLMGTPFGVHSDYVGRAPQGSFPFYVQPENFSETYCWWTDSPDDVPMVERSQFLGDPRHNPYRDLLDGDPDFPNRYNWFHDDLVDGDNARGDFPGLRRLWDRWHGLRLDVPRYFELLRTALVRSNAIYTTLTGYSYYYLGIGNEIGYDAANGYSNSIPVNRLPWGSNSNGYVNNITGRRSYVRDSVPGDDWFGMPWLGELYPDYAYPVWSFIDLAGGDASPRGNLQAGTGHLEFHRDRERDAYDDSRFEAYGSSLNDSYHRTGPRGCVSMFNNGDSGAHFNHHPTGGNGSLTATGQELADNYGFPIPSSTPISRPFRLDSGGNVPVEFDRPEYSNNRFDATLLREYFEKGSTIGSGLVQLEDPAGTDAAFIVVNGLSQTTTTGTSFIAKYCLLSMFQSLFEMGDTGETFRIKQPPRVEILAPTEVTELVDPANVTVQFATEWVRWDGQPYTETTPTSFAEAESELEYVLMYSRDNGLTWLYLEDDQPARAGVYPEDPTYRVSDVSTGDESYLWPTPASEFPDGTYLLRIEAYRTDQSLHYSHHQSRIYIQR